MNKEKIDLILEGDISKRQLTEQEKEIATKILTDLEGTLVIRATYILELSQLFKFSLTAFEICSSKILEIIFSFF